MPPTRKADPAPKKFNIRDVLPDAKKVVTPTGIIREREYKAAIARGPNREGPVLWAVGIEKPGCEVGMIVGPLPDRSEQDETVTQLSLLLNYCPENAHVDEGTVTIFRLQGDAIDPAYSWDRTAEAWVLRDDE